jgi:hypothetical protein
MCPSPRFASPRLALKLKRKDTYRNRYKLQTGSPAEARLFLHWNMKISL